MLFFFFIFFNNRIVIVYNKTNKKGKKQQKTIAIVAPFDSRSTLFMVGLSIILFSFEMVVTNISRNGITTPLNYSWMIFHCIPARYVDSAKRLVGIKRTNFFPLLYFILSFFFFLHRNVRLYDYVYFAVSYRPTCVGNKSSLRDKIKICRFLFAKHHAARFWLFTRLNRILYARKPCVFCREINYFTWVISTFKNSHLNCLIFQKILITRKKLYAGITINEF